MILGKPFFPPPAANRLGNHGDLTEARRRYYEQPSRNLRFLLEQRHAWLAPHIDSTHDDGVEVAAGIGVTRDFVHARSLLLTDFDHQDWLDVSDVDATATPFKDEQFDFVLAQNAIHHFGQPIRFFDEAARILKPGGLLLVQDVRCSLAARVVARLTRVEGYSFDVDVFDRDVVLSDPANLWEANNAIPDLLFDNPERFHAEVPQFELLSNRPNECLVFLNSGGVTHKTFSVPLPRTALRVLAAIDRVITRVAPNTFALQRSVVLRKRAGVPA